MEKDIRVVEIRERLGKATKGPWTVLAQTYGCGDMIKYNADFIQNAPTDIAYLLQDNADLRAEIQKRDEQIKQLKNPMNCRNGFDHFRRGWECDLDYDCDCGNCSEWEGQDE